MTFDLYYTCKETGLKVSRTMKKWHMFNQPISRTSPGERAPSPNIYLVLFHLEIFSWLAVRSAVIGCHWDAGWCVFYFMLEMKNKLRPQRLHRPAECSDLLPAAVKEELLMKITHLCHKVSTPCVSVHVTTSYNRWMRAITKRQYELHETIFLKSVFRVIIGF